MTKNVNTSAHNYPRYSISHHILDNMYYVWHTYTLAQQSQLKEQERIATMSTSSVIRLAILCLLANVLSGCFAEVQHKPRNSHHTPRVKEFTSVAELEAELVKTAREVQSKCRNFSDVVSVAHDISQICLEYRQKNGTCYNEFVHRMRPLVRAGNNLRTCDGYWTGASSASGCSQAVQLHMASDEDGRYCVYVKKN